MARIAKKNLSSASILGNPEFIQGIKDFLVNPMNDALYIFGPSGTGKTSTATTVAEELGFEVISITLNDRFDVQDLMGYQTLVNDKLMFVDGPLVKAMKTGAVLILNEIDLANPGTLAGMNDLLEGRKLTVIQNNGEVVTPHKSFRVIVTANTKGDGDSANFIGTQALNSAFLDRFRFLESNFLSFTQEVELLKSKTNLDDVVIKSLVRVASEVRTSHMNYSPEHIYISVPMSTRALLRWAKLSSVSIERGEEVSKACHQALKTAFSNRLSKDEGTYVHRLLTDIMPA